MKLPPSAIAEDDSHLWIDINSQFSKNKKLVELTGIEPATSWMQIRCSPNWATAPIIMAVDQVGLRGLEPRTSSLSGMRSNHLSYKPKKYSMRDHKDLSSTISYKK